MRPTRLLMACLAIGAISIAPLLGQEGHPLKGSWLGDWGPSKADRNQVFILMDWDGKAITGMINPGTDNIPLAVASLIPPPPPPPAPAGGGRGGNRGGGGGAAGAGGNAAPAAGAQGGGGNRGGGGAAAPAAGAQAGGGNRGGGGAAAPAAGAQAGGGNRGGGGAQGGGAGAAATPAPPQDWLVHLEANAKDRAGNTVRYIIDGKIENLGLYNRSIAGTWSHGNVKGDFRIQRQ